MTTPPPAPAKTSNEPVVAGFTALRIGDEDATNLPLSTLSLDERIAHLAAISTPTPDVAQQLRHLLNTKAHPIAFDGIEPSGRVTLAQGILRALNVQRLLAAGCRVRLWVADIHALLNNKHGGDLKKIQNLVTYLLEVWKALGLDPSTTPNLEILLASSEIARYSGTYWSRVLDIAGRFTIERVQQCTPIMGRAIEDTSGNTNRILYPIMQIADGLLVEADIYQMGTDQESAMTLLKEYNALKPESTISSPVILSHELLYGLKQEQFKMSTSDPESAIYMDDTSVELAAKVKKAYCPPGIVEHNPILQYMKHIVFPCIKESIRLERNEKNGGDLEFTSYVDLEQAYVSGSIHPADLKPCLIKYLNILVEPVRQHFMSGELKKLWTNIKKMKITSVLDNDKLVTLSIPGYSESTKEYKKPTKTLEERYTTARSVGEECIQDKELQALLEKKEHFICYDGFEPSGRMHIAQGVLRTVNVNKLTSSGAIFRFWVADWFAMLNHKMNGDLSKIQTVGRYMVEIWKSTGMDMSNVEFLWASKEIIAHGATYWLRVLDIARRTTIARTIKCCTIMGRKEKEGMFAAQILYPLMQCADIFFLKADICQLGMDQRKINMLARDYCELIKHKFKPIIISHHMLMGLKQGQEKMSKSDPESAIFMEDASEDVIRKIEQAYCPEKIVEANPILDYMKHIIFPRFANEQGKGVVITKDLVLKNYDELEQMYVNGEISPSVLKQSLAIHLNEILEPVRVHFSQGEAKELLATVRSYRITR